MAREVTLTHPPHLLHSAPYEKTTIYTAQIFTNDRQNAMNISSFFADVLGSSLRNSRWSWGSYDPHREFVFLRIWEDQLVVNESGAAESVLLLRHTSRLKSNGYRERKEHIEKMQAGARGFGIVCVAVNPSASGARKIKSFDDSVLLRLGKIEEKSEGIFAQIVKEVEVSDFSTVSSDIKAIMKLKLDSTEKEQLINARIGQGAFRKQVLERWDNQCAVTGAKTLTAIRASHIKPWRYSNNEERLDPCNGFPLVASLDALFDSGLISFDPNGTIMISSLLPESERKIFDLSEAKLVKKPSQEIVNYLAFHNEKIFQR
jgi:putative restriction endonuclease